MTWRGTCETCRFSQVLWRKGEEYTRVWEYMEPTKETRQSTAYICRRNAPRMAMMDNQSDGWPVVFDDAWCGEHQPLPPPPAQEG